ncbi:MAG: SH3 domain-containing protein [Clostridia bacterium]|nr:SH3 domain-containing protein [Clostridia bacterium]
MKAITCKRLLAALLLCLLLCPAARADEALTYDGLPEACRALFDAEAYADARFYVDGSFEQDQEYCLENGYGLMTSYPILSLRGNEVRVHLLDISDGAALIAESQTPMRLPDGYALEPPIYDTNGVFANQGWDYAYRETLNIYFCSKTDPCRVVQMAFANHDPDDPAAFLLYACDMQFNPARKLGSQPYDNLIYSFYGEDMSVVYSYQEGEGGHVEFTLPVKISRGLWTFDPASLPEDAMLFLAPAKVETAKHGSGGPLNLRAAADPGGKVLARMENGADIRYLERGDGWAVVLYKGRVGYARAEYIKGSSVY